MSFISSSYIRSLLSLVLFGFLLSADELSQVSSTWAAPIRPWQRGFQAPASPIAEGIIAFHDDLRIFLTRILCFVIYVFSVCLERYSYFGIVSTTEKALPKTKVVDRLVHASTLEVVWTIIPALILVLIAIPSFSLLYSVDEVIEPLFTVKVVGHQWYWTYEFLDPEVIARLYNESLSNGSEDSILFTAEGAGAFDSYRLSDDELAAGEGLSAYRLLTVDNHLFIPTERHVRTRITSADVLHSWAVPSLGVKVDACPGRLNQASLFIKREGLFYGQCSELCGVNHGFRPIGIVSQEFFAGLTPTSLDVEPLLTALQAIALELTVILKITNLVLLVCDLQGKDEDYREDFIQSYSFYSVRDNV